MAPGTPSEEDQQGTANILSWYDSSQPMHIDLVGDYAGKEIFLVEGDSLLRQAFEDDRIDFTDGFQLLHAVYVVERFLENLVKRHCQFHIAFFDAHEQLCVPPGLPLAKRSRYLLARAVVKRHLFKRLPETHPTVIINNFPSLQSEEWKVHLHVSPIHFVMSHDGAKSYTNKVVTESNKADEYAKTLFRGMIWYFNTHNLNVALINRVEFRDSKVYTMIVESATPSSNSRTVEAARFVGEISAVWEQMEEVLENGDEEEEFSISEDGLSKAAKVISEADLTERAYVAAFAAAEKLKKDSGYVFFSSALVLHSLTLQHVPLSQRRLPLVSFDKNFESEVDEFLSSVARISTEIMEDPSWMTFVKTQEIESDEIDLIDGRLFRVLLKAMYEKTLEDTIPKALRDDWEVLSALVKNLSGQNLSLAAASSIKEVAAAKVDEVESGTESFAVLPFSNEVFDKHLECIHVTTDNSITAQLGSMKAYRETTHWHNYRKPLVVKAKVPEKVSKWRNPLRTNQFYMREMTNYAASLTGATGKALEPETVTVGPKQLIKIAEDVTPKPEKVVKGSSKSKKETTPAEAKTPANAKKGTKKAAGQLTKAQQMIADNKEKKSGTESDKTFLSWSVVMKGLDSIHDSQDKYIKTKHYLDNLDTAKKVYLEGDVLAYILQSLLTWWAGYCKSKNKSAGYHVVALIWTTVRSICTAKSPISKEVELHMTKVCKLLAITDAMTSLTAVGDRKLSFVFKYPTQDLKIEVPQHQFQLESCGPYMDRMLDAKPDARVSFVPDGWQRKVLDLLDANKSVFVVAPTSAGKTFISFYAMEQILRADNDGVLVYVAPTKALVNQIAAEIQGRFSKNFGPLAGKGVWAIHTRDYRVNNSTGCQILVTVPHILQIMLLSPTNAKSWAPRVKKIIFDEIHSIGNSEDGVVWEQLLLLAPCPIIALSATVGNPEQFNDWLKETQKASGFGLEMVQHSTRYSDLRKYMYEPPRTFKFAGLGGSEGVGLGLEGLEGFEGFHPISSLIDKSRGMPDDLALEPRDCFTLWNAMVKFQTDKYPVPEALNPVKALPSLIRKVDIFAWEKSLKKVLLEWMYDRSSPFDKVVKELTPQEAVESGNVDPSAEALTNGDSIDAVDLKATSLPLLFQLHKQRALPAILFNYDRSACEEIAYAILAQLVEAEDEWKKGSQWKKLMKGYEEWKELKEKKSKKAPKPPKKAGKDQDDEGGSKMDRMRDEATDGSSIYDLFDPEAPQGDFSFSDPKRLQKQELADHIYQMRRKGIKEELINLLQRGIGVHHAGMNRKYRQTVEMLFRKGYLRVIIATGTLALGINMPCSTVVFSGDSVFLTALNFRQAAGRSGRRGFDLLGNVVFQGVSRERASRLLSSRLPDLTGHFPITTTLVLRLFTLLNDSKSAPYAIKAINSLLSQPRLYMGGQSFKEQVLHHLRFSIEYLRRNQLLGPAGQPINFTSCVSHLYYTENSTFAFHALLRGGYFHKLCADIDTKTDSVLHTMVLVLSHLFGRRVIRRLDDPVVAEKINRSASNVYLDPMPNEAVEILRKHNKDTLDIFATYVKTFSEQHLRNAETRLPLTQTPAGAAPPVEANGTANGVHKDDTGLGFLPSLPAPYARSAFDALSGLGDNFSTIDDLCSSTREGVFLESAVIPHLVLHPDESRSQLNSYLLDFFKHGDLEPLIAANGMRRSDVWFDLNDFSMVLATITTSLALYLGLGNDADPEMLDVMGSGDAQENEGDEQVAAAEEKTPTGPASNEQRQAPTIRKKKVAEDWDAGEDALVEEEDFHKNESQSGTAASDSEEYEQLLNVYKAFKKLKAEFDSKFIAIFA